MWLEFCPLMHAGLTSRPVVGRGAAAKEASPYTLLNQAHLALQLPQSLGLRCVLYAGHGDGSLLAVVASGLAIRCAWEPPCPRAPMPLQTADQTVCMQARAGLKDCCWLAPETGFVLL